MEWRFNEQTQEWIDEKCTIGQGPASLRPGSENPDTAGSLPTNSDVMLPYFSAVVLACSLAVLLPAFILCFLSSLFPPGFGTIDGAIDR